MSAISSAWKGAAAFVLLLNAFCQPVHAAVEAAAGQPDVLPAERIVASSEPFSLSTSLLPDGPLRTKWQGVTRAIEAETKIIAECRTNPATCGSPAALRFLGIVQAAAARSGLARLGEVNRAINLAIRPVSDLTQYGTDDYWSSPLATLTSGAGDCEDYAIAKLVALHEAGVAHDDLRLVILRDTATNDDHAVLAARFDGRWRILDNRTLVMIEDSEPRKEQPLIAIDAEGVKRFEQSVPAIALARQDIIPAIRATVSVETSGFDALALALVL